MIKKMMLKMLLQQLTVVSSQAPELTPTVRSKAFEL